MTTREDFVIERDTHRQNRRLLQDATLYAYS